MSAEIQAAYNDAMRQIAAQRAHEQLRTQQANQAAEDLYRRSQGDATHVHDQIQGYVGQQNQSIADLFTKSIADNQQSNSALASSLQGIAAENRNDMGNELSRLGVQGVGSANFAADSALNQMLAAQGSANEQANLKLSNQGAVEVGSLLASMNEGQRGSTLGKVLVNRDQTLQTNNNELALIMQKLAGEEANAAARMQEMMAAYAAQQAAARRSYGGGGRSGGYSSRGRSSGGGSSRSNGSMGNASSTSGGVKSNNFVASLAASAIAKSKSGKKLNFFEKAMLK